MVAQCSYSITRNTVSCVAQPFFTFSRDIWPLTQKIIANSGKSRFSGFLLGDGKIRYFESRSGRPNQDFLVRPNRTRTELVSNKGGTFTKVKQFFVGFSIHTLNGKATNAVTNGRNKCFLMWRILIKFRNFGQISSSSHRTSEFGRTRTVRSTTRESTYLYVVLTGKSCTGTGYVLYFNFSSVTSPSRHKLTQTCIKYQSW